MRISVIVPTRNRAQLLAVCVERIRAQTHPDVEMIVIDDGSEPAQAERNAELVRQAGGRYIRLVPPDQRGSGPSVVRNTGIGVASGELVAFCDDDDYWCDPEFLATAAGAFAAQPTLGLLFGNQEAQAGGTLQYATWQPRLEEALAKRALGPGPVVPVSKQECLVAAGDFAHLNICVLRKSLLDAVGGFDAGLRYCEDMDLYVRAVDRADAIACLRRTVAIHNVPDRQRQDNASTQVNVRTKNLALQLVANRLFVLCAGKEAQDYARRLGAIACRALALDAVARARPDEALTWAHIGGGWRQSLRWLAYTQVLRLRALAGGR